MSKVSIIIPIYNVVDYASQTVDSAMRQTVTDIEIILVDDGSTDGSGALCDQFAGQDSRIKVIHKENGGLSSARNAGADIASGDFVLFLDGDDFLRDDAVERLLGVMEAYPSDFIQFQYQEIDEKQPPIVRNLSSEIYQAHTSKELFENLYRLGGTAASGATKFLRREIVKAFPFQNIRHEDEMWCTQAFQNNLTVTYIPDELYYYVMRKGSIIHSTFHSEKLDSFTVSEKRIETLKKLHLDHLLHFEYERIFLAVLSLYCEARQSGNRDAMDLIRREFQEHAPEIKRHADLRGKFNIMFRLMRLNDRFIHLYYLYYKAHL